MSGKQLISGGAPQVYEVENTKTIFNG